MYGTYHRYDVVCSFAPNQPYHTTYEFNVNSMKFIVFERTHEVRCNDGCVRARWSLAIFSLFSSIPFVDYHPPFKSTLYTPNDIDFNFINKTVRLSHFPIKFSFDGCLCTIAHGWENPSKEAEMRDEGWEWCAECSLCYTSIIKLDKIDIKTNKFDR